MFANEKLLIIMIVIRYSLVKPIVVWAADNNAACDESSGAATLSALKSRLQGFTLATDLYL